jgi:hypothetical protein
MSPRLVVPGLALVGALLVGCGPAAQPPATPANPPAPKPVLLKAADHDTTLVAIGDHLVSLGWKVSPDQAQRRIVGVSPKGTKFGIGLHMGVHGDLNHVVMFKAFMPKPEAKGTPQVAELVAKLANNVNGVVYQVSDDQAVVCATWVYFLDTLDPRLMIRAMELLDQVAVVVMATQAPDLVKLLE